MCGARFVEYHDPPDTLVLVQLVHLCKSACHVGESLRIESASERLLMAAVKPKTDVSRGPPARLLEPTGFSAVA